MAGEGFMVSDFVVSTTFANVLQFYSTCTGEDHSMSKA